MLDLKWLRSVLILSLVKTALVLFSIFNRGYAMGVASRLATVIYVAMVMPIL